MIFTMIYVSKVSLIETVHGPDVLLLDIDLPNGCWPYEGNACAKLEVAGGSGWVYANKHFHGTKYERFSPCGTDPGTITSGVLGLDKATE